MFGSTLNLAAQNTHILYRTEPIQQNRKFNVDSLKDNNYAFSGCSFIFKQTQSEKILFRSRLIAPSNLEMNLFSIDVPETLFDYDFSIETRYHFVRKKWGFSGKKKVYSEYFENDLVKLELNSEPQEATVYYIPLVDIKIEERNRFLNIKNKDEVKPYKIPEGPTPVTIYVGEFTCYLVFESEGKFETIKYSPMKKKPKNKVYLKFSE